MQNKSNRPTGKTVGQIKKTPLVSVVITNYNYGRYVGRAIESVLNQTYKNIELIIIDDGSTDDSNDIITKYVKTNPEIIYIRQKNEGVVSARNRGMTTATGSFLCCLDADDFFNPEYIDKQYQYITEYDADVVYPNWQFLGDFSHKTDFPEFNFTEYQKQHLHVKPEALIRASSIKYKDGKLKYAYIPETKARANDWAYFISLAANGLKFKLAKDNYINYHVRQDAMHARFSKHEDVRLFYSYLTMLKKKYGEKIIEPIELPIDIIKVQDAEIREKDDALHRKDAEIREKDDALHRKDAEIRGIRRSLSWKITKPLRTLNHLIDKVMK